MRILSETSALEKLRRLKDQLRDDVESYEQNAESCATCDTPGACCLDAHFVNVRISPLEAVAIVSVIDKLSPIRRHAVRERVRNTASRLSVNRDAPNMTFSCPLYEKGTGCLVHDEAKPVPCIVHACYERRDDLPPDKLQDSAELAIDKLNDRAYGRNVIEPLPVAVLKAI